MIHFVLAIALPLDVRGALAIVDARPTCEEWTFRQAADFFARVSGFTREAADVAVADIAMNPEFAIACEAGRMQLKQLLAAYHQRTAGDGSPLDFHDGLLWYCSAPFAIVGSELLTDLDRSASAVRAAANY